MSNIRPASVALLSCAVALLSAAQAVSVQASEGRAAGAFDVAQAGGAAAKERAGTKPSTRSEQSIVALVNDEPITGYEVRQRTEMLSGGAAAEYVRKNAEGRWKAMMSSKDIQTQFQEFAKKRKPRTKEELQAIQKEFVMQKRNALMAQLQAEGSRQASSKVSKTALDELIDEKLKMQEAKRVGAIASEDEIDSVIKGIAERNKMSVDQLTKSLGGSLEPMKQRVRSTLAWNEVIRRKFGQQIAVATKDVEKFIAAAPNTGEDEVELIVQRVRVNMPAKLNDGEIAQRVSQAEGIRAKFTDCKTTSGVVAGAAGVRVDDLGKRRPSSFQEPTRSLLLNARDNEMLPPTVGDGGVDLFAVCGRNVIKAAEQKRTQAEGELKQKEFELLSKKHLKDLRQDASIEYR